MTDTFALSELAAIGRLGVARPILDAVRYHDIAYDDEKWHICTYSPSDFSINPATHLGAAALAYICARLLGASEEEACGASLVVTAAADSVFAPTGLRVTLYRGPKLVRSWAWKRTQGLEYATPELHDLPDTPAGRAAAILAVTRRCVKEAADGN